MYIRIFDHVFEQNSLWGRAYPQVG